MKTTACAVASGALVVVGGLVLSSAAWAGTAPDCYSFKAVVAQVQACDNGVKVSVMGASVIGIDWQQASPNVREARFAVPTPPTGGFRVRVQRRSDNDPNDVPGWRKAGDVKYTVAVWKLTSKDIMHDAKCAAFTANYGNLDSNCYKEGGWLFLKKD